MVRRVQLTLAILFVIAIASIMFGTVTPVDQNATPYVSALSDMAVGTAEAVPCNQKVCSGNVCVPNPNPDQPRACKIVGTNCQQTVCFP